MEIWVKISNRTQNDCVSFDLIRFKMKSHVPLFYYANCIAPHQCCSTATIAKKAHRITQIHCTRILTAQCTVHGQNDSREWISKGLSLLCVYSHFHSCVCKLTLQLEWSEHSKREWTVEVDPWCKLDYVSFGQKHSTQTIQHQMMQSGKFRLVCLFEEWFLWSNMTTKLTADHSKDWNEWNVKYMVRMEFNFKIKTVSSDVLETTSIV